MDLYFSMSYFTGSSKVHALFAMRNSSIKLLFFRQLQADYPDDQYDKVY